MFGFGKKKQAPLAALPENQDLRRTLLGVIVANVALDANLRSSNRGHELGDPAARRDAVVHVVSTILRAHGHASDRVTAEQVFELSIQYFRAFLEATEWVVNNLQTPDALVEMLNRDGAVEGVLASINIEQRFNSLLPPGLGKLTDDDLMAMEAGMAQAEREAQKTYPT